MRIRLLLLISVCLMLTDRSVYSQPETDHLIRQADNWPLSQQVDSLAARAWNLRERDPDSAIVLAGRGLLLAEELGDASRIARFSNYAGVIHLHYRFDYNRAIPLLYSARDMARQANDSVQLAYALNNLGDAYYLARHAGLARDLAQESMDIFQTLKDTLGIAYSYVNLALAARLDQQPEEAKGYFRQAITIGEASDNRNTVAYTLLETGRTLIQQDSLEQALQLLNQSYQMHLDMGNVIYGAHCQTAIGDVHYTNGDWELAHRHYRKALKMNRERSNRYGIATNQLKMALVYSRQGNKEDGLPLLNEAIRICEELELPDKLLEGYLVQAEFYQNLNEPQMVIEQFGRFLIRYNDLFSKQQLAVLEEIQKQNEIRNQLYRSQEEIRNRRNMQGYLTGIILLVLLAVLLITWRYQTVKKLNVRLSQSNDSKDKLFSIISHDLRKPLVSIIQSFDLLTEEGLSETNQLNLMKSLKVQTENTYSLLENLLSLSASRSGRLAFKPASTDLEKLIAGQISLLEPDLRKKELTVSPDLKARKVFADPDMLQIVIRNLLTNAMKYSQTGQTIRILSDQENNQVLIRVIDEGTGIDKQTLKSLFQADFVSSTQGTFGENGTGIGLSLCKELISRHNGSISVSSSPGTGAEFVIALPER